MQTKIRDWSCFYVILLVALLAVAVNSNFWSALDLFSLNQWCPILLLEGHHSAGFRCSSASTQLIWLDEWLTCFCRTWETHWRARKQLEHAGWWLLRARTGHRSWLLSELSTTVILIVHIFYIETNFKRPKQSQLQRVIFKTNFTSAFIFTCVK